MPTDAKVLLVDDDPTFREATAGLLARAGFHCDVAADARAGREALAREAYAVVVSDLRMPDNRDLEFARTVAASGSGTSLIIVTGYPSVPTAAGALELPVLAYLPKPFEMADLVRWIRVGIERWQTFAAFGAVRARMQAWTRDAEACSGAVLGGAVRDDTAVSAFTQLAVGQIAGSLQDLAALTERLAQPTDEASPHTCRILGCPRYRFMRRALADAIEVLERTRGAFKSKDLGDLRKRLEAVIAVDRD